MAINRLRFKYRSLVPRWVIFTIDTCIVLTALLFAFLLRFNFHIPAHELQSMYLSIPVMLFVRIAGFFLFRIYAGMIQYTGSEDAQRVAIMLALGTLMIGILNFISFKISGNYLVPFSVMIIEFFISVFAMSAYRLGVKILYEELVQIRKEKSNVIILGANEYGLITKKTLERDPKKDVQVIAFIDNKSDLLRQKMEGVSIYDSKNDLEELLQAQPVDLLIIAVPNIPASRKKQVVDTCLKYNVRVLHVPPMSKWINGELSMNQIREVKIEELLERDLIQLDFRRISNQLHGKRILITGAAGSIGSEIARQVSTFKPEKLFLLDQAETPLFELQQELKSELQSEKFEVVIGDVRNQERMENVISSFRPQIIYHAAAYKHVPMMEDNPSESLLTNVQGTMVCADLAVKFEVETFVFVSTDKAVNPTNVMGASKRIAEIYVQSLNQFLTEKNIEPNTHFITTRFGNVLGSNGSVIPQFRKQIAEGGPVTVTHPEVTRFFMTIPEACQLVLEAGAMGNGGEIFIFDMGEPVRIVDLAKKMIQLSGMELGKDIQIAFTGLRPGEKLVEELLNTHENTIQTHHPKIMIAKVREYAFESVHQNIRELITMFDNQDNLEIVSKMKELVPEFISNNSVFEELDQPAAK
ncbi:MAG: nucleoside-diphosphate sugar epimerase/dehydratase [Chitinophagales bacterium]